MDIPNPSAAYFRQFLRSSLHVSHAHPGKPLLERFRPGRLEVTSEILGRTTCQPIQHQSEEPNCGAICLCSRCGFARLVFIESEQCSDELPVTAGATPPLETEGLVAGNPVIPSVRPVTDRDTRRGIGAVLQAFNN